jgi:hypothetical protein
VPRALPPAGAGPRGRTGGETAGWEWPLVARAQHQAMLDQLILGARIAVELGVEAADRFDLVG